MTQDQKFMKEAIRLAREAAKNGNEPFGAVLEKDGEIFSNENQIYTKKDYTFHAEMGLIRRMAEEKGIYDLSEYTLYSSCEPCFMCSGAMVWAKLGRLVYAASDEDLGRILGKKGCNCSKIVFSQYEGSPKITAGIMREESIEVMKEYFECHKKN